MYEKLESRRMFASGGTWTPLYLNGTSAADTITLNQSGNTLTVVKNGVSQNYTTKWISGIGTTPGTETYSGISKVVINGLVGNDWIKANSTVTVPLEVYGNEGIDSLRGGSSNDKLYGGSNLANGISEMSADNLEGGNGNDALTGPAQSVATLVGGAGNDTLSGGAFNDAVYGGADNDVLYGNGGNDFVNGETGSDNVFGGLGTDTISYQYITAVTGVTVRLDDIGNDGVSGENDNIHTDIEQVWGSKGNDQIWGSSGNNLLAGDTGNDQIHGGAGNDSCYGDSGNDSVWGDAGDDVVSGGDWNDSVYGGDGADSLFGDAGNDVLVSIGGNGDNLWGGANGLDSFWADEAATDSINDASSYETSNEAVHRVTAFTNFKYRTGIGTIATTNITKDLYGQNIPDPVKFDLTRTNYLNFSNKPLFNNGVPSMDDIDQAGGGSDPADCWFMAVLSAAAMKNPNFIKQRIVELGDGTYAMRIWKNGTENFIRLDAELPANATNGPLYAGYGQGESIWVAMMEKAMATFRDIRPPNDGGTPNDTSDDFDGDPEYAAYERVAFGGPAWEFLGRTPTIKNPSNMMSASQRAQWAIDELSAGRAVVIAWGGHVRTVEGGVWVNGELTELRLRDPYGPRYNTSISAINTNGAWIISATV